MRILYQWTRANPRDWQEIDSSLWADLPKSPEPTGGETLTDDEGEAWIFRINVQGLEFTADHYAVEHIDETSCRVTIWNDDPEDYPEGERFARIWTFRNLAPDDRFGGAINTNQTQEIFADEDVGARIALAPGITYRPYTEFVLPPEGTIRHGIWVDAAANVAHDSARSPHNWHEWTEGLDPSELDANGHLLSQRGQGRYSKNTGTKTFIARSTPLSGQTAHTLDQGSHDFTFARFLTSAASAQQQGGISGNESLQAFTVHTAANEPNDAAWPTGNYRFQLDITDVGADVTYGLLDQGSALGHFARVNSGLTADLETKQQAESAFSGTGLQLATTGSVSWTSGSASDRFGILISAARPASHGNQNLGITLNEDDDFADGPWPSELEDTVAVTDNLIIEFTEGAIQVSESDTVAVTDNLAIELCYERTVSDAVVLADNTQINFNDTFEVIATDVVAITDNLIVEMTYERTASDTVAVADNVQAEKTISVELSDTVGVVDNLLTEADYVRIASDNIQATDDLCEVDQVQTTIGHFQTPTATGTVQVRGLPFQPKGIIFWGVREPGFVPADTPDSTMLHGVAADGSISKAVILVGEGGATNDERNNDEANSVVWIDNVGARLVEGDVTSYVSDGFDVNFPTTVDTVEHRIFFTAYGGDGLQAEVGQVTVSDGAVTGLAFSPELVFLCTYADAPPGNPPANPDFGIFSHGWLDTINGGEWWVGRYQGNNAAAEATKDSALLSSGHMGQIFAGALTWEMSFTARTADGWTWAGTNTDEVYFLAMTLGGRRCSIGTFTAVTATDPQTQTMPDLGFPKAQMITFGSGNEVDEVATTPNGTKVSKAFMTPLGLLSVLNTDEINVSDADSQSTDQAMLFGNLDAVALREGTIANFQTATPDIVWDPNDTTNAIIIGYVAIEGCNIASTDYSRTVSDTISVADNLEIEVTKGIDDDLEVCDQIQVIRSNTTEQDIQNILCDLPAVTDNLIVELITPAAAGEMDAPFLGQTF